MKNKPIFFGKTLIALSSLLFCIARPAQAVVFVSTIDLQNGSTTLPENPFLSYVQEPTLNRYDAYDTVLKLNFAPENQIDIAKFLIEYDGSPIGYTVNIGDSRTNDGNKGDYSPHQSNDAEMQIVNNNMTIFSNDYAPEELRKVGYINDLVTENSVVSLYVKDQFLGWSEGLSTFTDSNFVTSPYLYALDGQSDLEGPINYDIYAAFNSVIYGNSRPGAGVSKVTICMADQSNIGICDQVKTVPEPSVLLGLLGLGILGLGSQAKSKAKKMPKSHRLN
jgi:hypothetical protein